MPRGWFHHVLHDPKRDTSCVLDRRQKCTHRSGQRTLEGILPEVDALREAVAIGLPLTVEIFQGKPVPVISSTNISHPTSPGDGNLQLSVGEPPAFASTNGVDQNSCSIPGWKKPVWRSHAHRVQTP